MIYIPPTPATIPFPASYAREEDRTIQLDHGILLKRLAQFLEEQKPYPGDLAEWASDEDIAELAWLVQAAIALKWGYNSPSGSSPVWSRVEPRFGRERFHTSPRSPEDGDPDQTLEAIRSLSITAESIAERVTVLATLASKRHKERFSDRD